jgi:serine phosphatase RsbU (regulator of sigma subunit)
VLGVLPNVERPSLDVQLGPGDWTLLIYTDGLIEGRADGGRLGVDGLRAVLTDRHRLGLSTTEIPAWLVGEAEERNGEPLADDVAMLLLASSPRPSLGGVS